MYQQLRQLGIDLVTRHPTVNPLMAISRIGGGLQTCWTNAGIAGEVPGSRLRSRPMFCVLSWAEVLR